MNRTQVNMYPKFTVILLLLVLAFDSGWVYADTGGIEGKVVNELSGESLGGATVYIEDLEVGTVAHKDGSFKLTKIPVGEHTLKVELLGFTPETKSLM